MAMLVITRGYLYEVNGSLTMVTGHGILGDLPSNGKYYLPFFKGSTILHCSVTVGAS